MANTTHPPRPRKHDGTLKHNLSRPHHRISARGLAAVRAQEYGGGIGERGIIGRSSR